MSDKYVMIVVDNGDNRGETLVRIWPSGQVEADYRGAHRDVWTPVGLLGGGMRFEGADGGALAGVALVPADPADFHSELVDPPFDQDAPPLVVTDTGPLTEVLGRFFDREQSRRDASASPDEEGHVELRFVFGMLLFLATCLVVASCFPTGVGS